MFVTDKFVFLHIPKTGGTFVHYQLRKIYARTFLGKCAHSLRSKFGVALPFMRYRYREFPKHTIRRELNRLVPDLPIVLCVRNPFDVYVSQYKFRWWQQFPEKWFVDLAKVKAEFGKYSEFDFETFVRATLKYSHWAQTSPTSQRPFGPMSAEWLRYFTRNPNDCINCGSEDNLFSLVRRELESVTILRTETLAVDLCSFLDSLRIEGTYRKDIMSSDRIYPGPRTRNLNDDHEGYYSEGLKAELSRAEWLLFSLFPEYLASKRSSPQPH